MEDSKSASSDGIHGKESVSQRSQTGSSSTTNNVVEKEVDGGIHRQSSDKTNDVNDENDGEKGSQVGIISNATTYSNIKTQLLLQLLTAIMFYFVQMKMEIPTSSADSIQM